MKKETNKFPQQCNQCIVFAVCKQKPSIECSILYKWIKEIVRDKSYTNRDDIFLGILDLYERNNLEIYNTKGICSYMLDRGWFDHKNIRSSEE